MILEESLAGSPLVQIVWQGLQYLDVPVLSVSWSVVDHSVIIQALKKGLIEHEASDTGGVPRWKSSCPDRLAEATLPWHIPGTSIDTGHLRHLPVYGIRLQRKSFKETNHSVMTLPGVNDTSPATCFFLTYNDMYVLYATT